MKTCNCTLEDDFNIVMADSLNSKLQKLNAPFFQVCSSRKKNGKKQITWRRYTNSCLKNGKFTNAYWTSENLVNKWLKKNAKTSLSALKNNRPVKKNPVVQSKKKNKTVVNSKHKKKKEGTEFELNEEQIKNIGKKYKIISRRKPVKNCDDTCLVEAIKYLKKLHPAAEALLEMAFTKGYIDPKKYNQIGKDLLKVRKIEDVSTITAYYHFQMWNKNFKGTKNKTVVNSKPKKYSKIVYGDNAEVETQTTNYKSKYAIVELDDIIPSSNPFTFAWNKNYPKLCQTRDYLSKSEQAKVIQYSSKFKPSHLVNDSPVATTGSPITNDEGVVLGGNGRTMVLKRLQNYGKYEQYTKYLKSKLGNFGFKNSDLSKFKFPALVRIIAVDMAKCSTVSNELNADLRQESDISTEAIGLAKQLSDKQLKQLADIFSTSDDLTFNQIVEKPVNQREIESILKNAGLITSQNYSKWVDLDTNMFTKRAKENIESILLGVLLPDKRLIKLAKNYSNKLIKTIPQFIQIKTLPNNWNIIPDIRKIIELEHARRKAEIPRKIFVSQSVMFSKPISERVKLIWAALDGQGITKFRHFIESYLTSAKSNSGSSMFASEKRADSTAVLKTLNKNRGLSDKIKKQSKKPKETSIIDGLVKQVKRDPLIRAIKKIFK